MLGLHLVEFGESFFWLPILLDALLISLAAIITVSILIKKGLLAIKQQGHIAWVEIQIGLIVFFIEIIIMQVFEYNPWFFASWQEIIIDGFMLALFSSVGIYFIVLKPAMEALDNYDVTASRFDSTGITILFSYLSIITVFLMFIVLSYQNQFRDLQSDMIEEEKNSQKFFKIAFEQQLNRVVSDILSISQQANVLEFFPQITESKRKILLNDFLNQVTHKAEYDQLRLLDASGREIIRIQQVEDGAPTVVDGYALQDKSDRYYFKESLQLGHSQVYISRIDLNEEYGEIELPYKPVIRVSSAVIVSGKVVGIVIVNLKAKLMLDKLTRFYTLANSSRQLLDSEGHWIFGGEANNTGFKYVEEDLITLPKTNPALWLTLQKQHHGVYDSDGNQTVFQSIGVDNVRSRVKQENSSKTISWYLVSVISKEILTGQMGTALTMLIYTYLFISLILGVGAILLARALRQKKEAERKTMLMVYSDNLTGLKNRKYFQWKLIREIETAKQQQSQLALLCLDLNKFKVINDEMGHEAGDLVLRKVASILLQCLRDDDTVARIGGDEFVAILPRVEKEQELQDIGDRIISLVTEGLDIGGMNFYLGINIGIATMNNYDEPIRSFIARADQAMYDSKADQLNKYVIADMYRAI